MDIIERLPWHYKYMILTEGLKNIEKEETNGGDAELEMIEDPKHNA